MTAPSWSTPMTDFYLEGASTVTALGGGAAGLDNPETDFFIQGANCLSKAAFTNAVKGFIVDGVGGNITIPTDGAIILFVKYDAAGSLDTKTNGGLRVIVGSANSAYWHYYVGGKNTIAFDSWAPYTIDPNTATADNSDGSPAAEPGMAERWIGVLAYLPTTSGPTKGYPLALDAVRYGRCTLQYLNGDGAPNYNTFALAEAYANDPTRRWGLLQYEKGVYVIQGFHSIGITGTPCDFRDSNKVVFWRASGNNNLSNNSVSDAFNRMEVINASSHLILDNVIFQALGTRARGDFYHTAGEVTLTNCQFVSTGLMSLLSTTSMTDCIFRSTGVITAPGSTLSRSKILTSRAAADASALVWNVATDPATKLNNMEFSKGTAAHHAIEFGTSAPTTINLSGMTFTGFNATNGQNDSVLYFPATSGHYDVNASGCVGTISYKAMGTTTVTVTSGVALTIQANVSLAGAEIRIYDLDTSPPDYGTELAGTESNSGATYVYTGAASNVIEIQIMKSGYVEYTQQLTMPSTNTTIDVTLKLDENL
jgi:hypothetical protein